MSASLCIKCEKTVSGYEKYCPDCLDTYGVKQDVDFWQTRGFGTWQKRESVFQSDLAAVPADYKKPKAPSRHIRHIETIRNIPAPVLVSAASRGKNNNPAYRKRFGSRATK
jgi:hypothetical protein